MRMDGARVVLRGGRPEHTIDTNRCVSTRLDQNRKLSFSLDSGKTIKRIEIYTNLPRSTAIYRRFHTRHTQPPVVRTRF